MKIAVLLVLALSTLAAQTPGDTPPEAHVAVAKTAAGEEYQNLFNFLCAVPGPRGGGGRGGGQRQGPPPGPPDRSTWYAEPVKVFDNLYFLGQTEYSVWAVTTSQGVIVIDTIFDYSVEEEVAGGLKKLGLDPANIKYAVVSHPHPDHHGGAKFLQDRYGTRIIMSAADWDFLERTNGTKPKRDMVAMVRATIQRHRAAGRSGYDPFQPHRLGQIQNQFATVGQTCAGQPKSIPGR